MNDFQHAQLIDALATQTAAIRDIHALIVRIIVWSAVGSFAYGILSYTMS